MVQTTTLADLNDPLARLLNKYAVQPPGPWQVIDGSQQLEEVANALTLTPGCLLDAAELSETTVPLLPWRHQRRFVELARLVADETVTPLLMCRFACLTDGRATPLSAILYREFDLIEWLSGSPIVGLYASMGGSQAAEKGTGPIRRHGPEDVSHKLDLSRFLAANLVVRLASGVIGSVEVGTTLPAGAAVQDRHELICRRGVASDHVVDTQVAQSSVYVWSAEGNSQHTDVDAELFGLDVEQVSLVRSAYEVLCQPTLATELRQNHARLCRLVELAYESNRRRQRLQVENVAADATGSPASSAEGGSR